MLQVLSTRSGQQHLDFYYLYEKAHSIALSHCNIRSDPYLHLD